MLSELFRTESLSALDKTRFYMNLYLCLNYFIISA